MQDAFRFPPIFESTSQEADSKVRKRKKGGRLTTKEQEERFLRILDVIIGNLSKTNHWGRMVELLGKLTNHLKAFAFLGLYRELPTDFTSSVIRQWSVLRTEAERRAFLKQELEKLRIKK